MLKYFGLLLTIISMRAYSQELPSAAADTAQAPIAAKPDAAQAPAVAKPVKKAKPVCSLVAVDGLTAVYLDKKRSTPESQVSESISQLKQFIDNKVCTFKKPNCSLIAKLGESAVSLDDNPASSYNSNPSYAINELKQVKSSGICNFVEPTYSILSVDGRIAVYIDGNRATPYSANETSAQEDLSLFTADSQQAGAAVEVKYVNPVPSAVKDQKQVGENKLKNFECWKGASSTEQERNKLKCEAKLKSNQICETSKFLHDGNIFDVCLQGFEGKPNRIVNCFKGYNANQKKENLKTCRNSLSTGQVCETSWAILEQWPNLSLSKNDVCIME